MTSNPYERSGSAGSNPYGGPNFHNGGPQGNAQSPTAQRFIDPYQPEDHQPIYPPAVRRRDLARESHASSGRTSSTPLGATVRTSSSRMAGLLPAVCMFLAAALVLDHGALLALGLGAILYAMGRAPFTKGWAANCINLVVLYFVLVAANFIILGIADAAGASHLRHTVGDLLRYAFSLVLAAGAVLALLGRMVRMPFSLPALRR